MQTVIPVEVNPDSKVSTHHLSLDDGYTEIGLLLASREVVNPDAVTSAPIDRTALKTTQGNSTYYDFEKPWTPTAQDDFSGGMTGLNLEEDATKYNSGISLNTIHKKIILSGERNYGTGTRGQQTDLPGSVTWHKMTTTAHKYLAKRIVANSVFTVASVSTILRRVGSPDSLVISFCEDNAGVPGSVISTVTLTIADFPDFISYNYKLTTSRLLAVNDVIWITWQSTIPDQDNYWMIGANATRTYALISATGSSWSAAPIEPYYIFRDALQTLYPIFFDYKYAKYLCISKEGTTPKLYIQGYRGKASVDAAVDGLTDTTQSWPIDGLIGQTVTVYAGTGSTQLVISRKIISNTATKVLFDIVSAVAFDATSEYVISGGMDWHEITGHGLTGVCTDIVEWNGVAYFALGKAINIRKMRWTTAGYAYADDGTNKAEFLTIVREPAATKMWMGTNDPCSIAKASIVAWGTAMTFATALQFDDAKYGRITRLGEYGDTTKVLWVMREAFIFTVTDANVIEEFPLKEMTLMADKTNGKAFLLSNIYLYFNWGSSIYRWYNKDLKDFGPVSGEGMPPETVGYCTRLLGYPGCIYAAFSPYSPTGFSTVYVHNGVGWAELYRSASPGTLITNISFQTLGTGVSRLWIFDGNDLVCIPTPTKTLIPYKDPTYNYYYEGVFVSGYYAANMYNIFKLYNSVVIFSSYLSDTTWIELDYQLDESTTWVPIKEFFTISPSQEVSLRSSDTKLADIFKGVTGKQFRYRLRIYTSDKAVTPIIRSIVIEAISRIPIKYAFTANIKIEDRQRNLREADTQIASVDVIAKLREWAANLTPLRLRSIYPEFNDKIVFLDAPPLTPTATLNHQYSLSIVVTEL
jgi:hypothetical protein